MKSFKYYGRVPCVALKRAAPPGSRQCFADEQICWDGGPAFVPFVLTGLAFFVLGLLWGPMDFGWGRGVGT